MHPRKTLSSPRIVDRDRQSQGARRIRGTGASPTDRAKNGCNRPVRTETLARFGYHCRLKICYSDSRLPRGFVAIRVQSLDPVQGNKCASRHPSKGYCKLN